ncbi:protein of unknown function [Escherichia coli]|nr:hypothetical protein AL505_30109 [Escherichia coli]VZZ89591.1 protein of unknown function [Escherichia coli]
MTKNWAKTRAYALLKKTPVEECNDAAFNRQRFPTRVAGLLRLLRSRENLET